MKKIILSTLLSTVLSAQLFADCNVLNFGPYIPMQKIKLFGSNDKETGQVVNVVDENNYFFTATYNHIN